MIIPELLLKQQKEPGMLIQGDLLMNLYKLPGEKLWFFLVPGDPDLAYDWLVQYIKEKPIDIYKHSRAIRTGISSLDEKAKIQIINIIPPNLDYCELINWLIGDDLEVYHFLLAKEDMEIFHLVPLTWNDQDIWIDKALLALEAGYEPLQVASAAYGFPLQITTWTGRESIMREEWVKNFDSLISHEDKRIQEIGRIGKTEAEKSLWIALQREHDEEIFGLDRSIRRNRFIS